VSPPDRIKRLFSLPWTPSPGRHAKTPMPPNLAILLNRIFVWIVVGAIFLEALLTGCLWMRVVQKDSAFPSSTLEGFFVMAGGATIALTANWQWHRSHLLFCVAIAGLGSALAGAGAFVFFAHLGWSLAPAISPFSTIR
jgi:hypothetical protein